jgi:hypothetical protein
MAFYSGSTGTIQFKKRSNSDYQNNSTLNLKVTEWTMNSSAQLLDVTTLGDYDKNSVYGLRTHTGTLRLLYYTDQDFSTPAKNAAAWFIDALSKPGTIENKANSDFASDSSPDSLPIRLKLYLKGDTGTSYTSQDSIEFDANITSVGYASTVGDVTSVQVQFETTGRIIRSAL